MKTIVIYPLNNIDDYERFFDIKAYGNFERENSRSEYWYWNSAIYRIKKKDIEQLKKEDRY